MLDKIYFDSNGTRYYFTGIIDEYFYAGGYLPIKEKSCKFILHKLQFVFEIWLQTRNHEFFGKVLPEHIYDDFNIIFKDYNTEFDLSHFSILEYKTLENYDLDRIFGIWDPHTKNIIFKNENISLYVSYPYNYVTGISDENEFFEINELNIEKANKIIFSDPKEDSNPILFMSKEQEIQNHKKLDDILKLIIKSLELLQIKIYSCEDLINYIHLK